MDVNLSDIFGSSPKTILTDTSIERTYKNATYSLEFFHDY